MTSSRKFMSVTDCLPVLQRCLCFSIFLVFSVLVNLDALYDTEPQNTSHEGGTVSGNHLSAMCKHDQKLVDNLFKQNPKLVNLDEWVKFLMYPIFTGCNVLKMAGGKYLKYCHVLDGQKFFCMDNFVPDNCLIYSFGVGGDWSWELAMEQLGCTVHTFDPTKDYPDKLSDNVFFYKIGVKNQTVFDKEKNEVYHSLMDILKMFGHEHESIFYLKMDVEADEIEGLPVWIQSGAFDNVNQFGIELHKTNKKDVVASFISSFQTLYKLDFRLVSFDDNACSVKRYKSPYLSSAEILFQRQKTNVGISTTCG